MMEISDELLCCVNKTEKEAAVRNFPSKITACSFPTMLPVSPFRSAGL